MSKPIRIALVGTQIMVDHPRRYVRVTEEVEWVCTNDLPFIVEFKEDSPFRNRSYCKGRRTGLPVVGSGTREYEYSIWVNGYTLDPVIIIDEPPP